MSIFEWGVSDILAISGLAVKVYTAYGDAPEDYKHISDEVKSLQLKIDKAARHFESNTLSNNNRQEGQEVLKGCESVLKDLNSLIEKYNSPSSNNTSPALQTVKVGVEDVATLRARLISNTALLSSFIQSCEFLEMQAQLTNVLGLHHTDSRVSLDSITSFAGSINTKKAYKKFCKSLFQTGVTAEMISQKEGEILKIFKPENTATSSQVDDYTIEDKSQLPPSNCSRSRFSWVQDFLVGPLMLAAATAGNTKLFISTLEYIQNINFEDGRKETALHKASSGGYNDIVQLLLTKGASIEATDKDTETPLHFAAQNGRASTVELLLKNGAPIEAMNNNNGTPLHVAITGNIFGGRTRMVKLLLEKGALTEAMNKDGHTPLHLAARHGYPDAVELLLAKGASTEATDRNDDTPLHLAILERHTRVVELLLRKGASIEPINTYNYTPLDYAAQIGDTRIFQLLKDKDAEPVTHGSHA